MDHARAEELLASAEEARGVPDFVERIASDYPDHLKAIEWFLDNSRPDEAMRMGIALQNFWMSTERLEEGASALERVLAGPEGDESLRGRTSMATGFLHFWVGNDDRSTELFRIALDAARATDDVNDTAQALTGLARVALRSEDYPESHRLASEALKLTEGTEHFGGLYNSLHILGVTSQMSGRLLDARDYMIRTIDLVESMGRRKTMGSESANLAMVELQLGNLDRAEELERFSLEVLFEFEDFWWIPYNLSGMSAIALARGQLNRAATLLGAAEAMVESQGAAWPPDEVIHYQNTLQGLEAQMEQDDFERARADGRAMASEDAIALALNPAGK